ncbi:MAG: four helix bundle protein [Bacteroidia bacterium]
MSRLKSFEDLNVWKEATKLRRLIMEIIKKLPNYEQFELASQMRRASRSVTHNIAEGYGRFHYQENIQFCRTSRGSAYELLDQIISAFDEGYISDDEQNETRKQLDTTIKLLNGYIGYLSKAKAESQTNTNN